MIKRIIQIILLAVIVFSGFLIYNSIMTPLKYKQEKDRRSKIVINKLNDIRNIQLHYKSVYGEYADSWDKLAEFVENGKIPVVKKINTLPDSLSEMSVAEALKKGFIKTDTFFVSVYDSIFKERKDFSVKNFYVIPFSEGQKFTITAGEIDKGNVRVKVFEVSAPYEIFLKGLDEDMIKMEDKHALILGSMVEPSTDGNWE